MAGIAQSLVSQIQQAGQPRIAKSTTTITGEEAPNIGMMGLLLAMLLEGEKTKDISPAIPPESFMPTGGFMPTETMAETPLPAPSNPMQAIQDTLGATTPTATPPQSDIPGAPWHTYTPAPEMNIQELLDLILGGGGK